MACGYAAITSKVRIGAYTMDISGAIYGGKWISLAISINGVAQAVGTTAVTSYGIPYTTYAGVHYVTLAGFRLRIVVTETPGVTYGVIGSGYFSIYFEDSYNYYTGIDWVPVNGEDFFEVGPTTVSGSDECAMSNSLTVKLPVLQEVV